MSRVVCNFTSRVSWCGGRHIATARTSGRVQADKKQPLKLKIKDCGEPEGGKEPKKKSPEETAKSVSMSYQTRMTKSIASFSAYVEYLKGAKGAQSLLVQAKD